MAENLKISQTATEKMYRVKSRLNLQNFDDLHPLRIAFARSLQTEAKLDLNTSLPTPKGKEIKIHTLEQKDGILFRCLLQQHYGKKLNDDDYENFLLKHIEHGLNILDQDTEKITGYDYLARMSQKGFQDANLPTNNDFNETTPTQGFEDVISIRVGVDKETQEPFTINYNKIDEHSNSHIGVVGTTGSGKTYFIKYLLTKLREETNYKTNFVFFDYKGDVFNEENFVADCKAEVLSVMKTPLPINIFRGREKKQNAERIVQLIRDVEANIGKVQEDNLYNAIVDAYDAVESEVVNYPDFSLVRQMLENINSRPDSLTSVFRPLTEHNLFANRETKIWDSLIDKTLIIDIHDLPACKDLVVFFVLNEMYRQLKEMGSSKENAVSKTREMRTVIVIDEAHHFLKSKKRVGILENMIRDIRSMGASVILLSQSPDDFDQHSFNFMELLEFVYVLSCKPKSSGFLKQFFGLSPEEANNLLREVSDLNTGQAVTKGANKKVKRLELCK
jgi:DNA sulfur modification protein DndE